MHQYRDQGATKKTLQMSSSLQGAIRKIVLSGVLLVLLGAKITQAGPPTCCGSNNFLDLHNNSNRCDNGNEISINCSYGYFMYRPELEPEEYAIKLDSDNRSWLIFDNSNSYNVSPEHYCLVKDQDSKELLFICFFEDSVEAHQVWRLVFYGAFSMISSIFLGLTLLVYLVLPELRELQDKATISMIISFMVSFFLTGNQQLNTSILANDFICLFIAFLMYYSYMCAFFWLNIISLNIWRSVWFPSWKVHNDVLFIIYSGVGWGLPLCFLALAVIGHHTESSYLVKPGFGVTSCWFHDHFSTWTYFYGPIMILLSINLIYLTLTGWKLWRQYKDLSCCKLKILRFRCIMCFKLGLIMGFTWIFEVLSFAIGGSNEYYWILPDVMNAMQGFLTFLILVACRKRVRKLLAQRKPFNIPFPKSWAAYADLENCDPVGPEELELSQSS